MVLQPLENGLSFATRLKVSNLGVLYAVALLF